MEYTYSDYSKPDPPHQPFYLDRMIQELRSAPGICHVLDAGCGDANFTASLANAGFVMYGLDASKGGIAKGMERYPSLKLSVGSVYDDLLQPFGRKEPYDAIVSIEVIEHLYSPREFFRQAHRAVRPGGLFIVTTPYFGYLKTLLMAVTNRFDQAMTVLWEGGHIKHFSYKTLRLLGEQQGFKFVSFYGAGRVHYLWSGQMMVFRSMRT